MDLTDALTWAAKRKHGVLITIRSDGRPQSSDIVYGIRDGLFEISVTNGRAKTANMRRDPRVVLHLTDPATWSYVSFDARAELSEPTKRAGDATSDLMVDCYAAVAGEPHPDLGEYRQAMADEGRLLVRLTPTGAVGQVH